MIIGLSGRKQSGKDTTGKIINILANSPQLNDEGVLNFLRKNIIYNSNWQIKKFADKLKDIVCSLIGCTREDLENEEFKNKELGEQWWYYKSQFNYGFNVGEHDEEVIFKKGDLIAYGTDSAKQYVEVYASYAAKTKKSTDPEIVKLTPRLMLQLLGTEGGRKIIHPNIWVNSTMSDYKSTTKKATAKTVDDKFIVPNLSYIPKKHWGQEIESLEFEWSSEPNWVITDMRFPNELDAVNSKGGISIRVYRGEVDSFVEEHESETALDNAEFNYQIDNNGTLEELIGKIRIILIEQNIIDEQKRN